jgi:hypothetical protein
MVPEVYRGIEFVRIAAMPTEVRNTFQATFDRAKIIKILREKELLTDCILYTDFVRWQGEKAAANEVARSTDKRTPVPVR